MEEIKNKRNIMPLVILLILVGLGAAALYKPQIKPTSNALSETDTQIKSGLIATTSLPLTLSTNQTSADTFCETAWVTTGGTTVVPNIPNLGKDEHVCGNPKAKLIIIEYTDFECPYCKVIHPTLQKLVSESSGQIAWVLRHYPIDQLHSRARHEAEAAECAYEQQGDTGFWKYADKVFSVTSSNNSLSPDLLPLIADAQGLDKNAFATCLASGKYLPKIAAQQALAEDKGPIGTPNSRIILNGKEVEEVKGAVDYATMKAKTDLWLKAQ